MTLPRCSVFIAQSLDGRIARADGRIDFLDIAAVDGEDYGYRAFFGDVDCLVVGRGTYDTVAGFPEWPWPNKRVVVLTHRPFSPLKNEEPSSEEPAALMARLGAAGVKHVYVDGGNVISQFFRAGLIDDVTLTIIPTILGGGRPLFGGGEREARLQLTESRTYPNSVVQLRYRVQR